MDRYVDGFLLPVPKRNIPAYLKMAKSAARVWRELGALEVRECIGDDLMCPGMLAFPRVAKAKPAETVVFSWIVYKSRDHRDKVNAKVMKDPRIAKMMKSKKMPFDVKRMAYGGFRVGVDA
jgi:uncharacterized protein YbaA (DUF1428 family)